MKQSRNIYIDMHCDYAQIIEVISNVFKVKNKE